MSNKKIRIWVLTMFDDYFTQYLNRGILGSAFRNERGDGISFEFKTVSIPKYSKKGFKGVDDAPFGGGVGMIMRADALKDALIKGVVELGGYDPNNLKEQLNIVCPAPRGRVWNHQVAVDFANQNLAAQSTKDLVFVCGRYEGIDERFLENYVDEYYSLGDYILTGGELAVMIMLDSAMRFSPGILGNKLSALEESFSDGKLEHALYTRPQEFEGKKVPDALLSGDPKN